ncbi:acyl-CoA N-acyltransferase [Ascobolus immersus RN42]|uniref:Histone acetyltransferase type B catalytic subunit n=1 Tax=Ascobolus immersus RN42 TaxID=1160509 RepID=A0A3N4I9P9_ASCIM|nr:acyl-CoA N-acyltransferase [Ascobolus immersus RN42]
MSDEWATSANECIKLSLVDPETQKNVVSFNPAMTYQIFDEAESIYGYKGLKVDLKFACDDLTPCITASWKEKIDAEGDAAAQDPVEILKEHLPEDVYTSESEWKAALKSRTEPFTPPGTCIHTYTHSGTTFSIYRTSLPTALCKTVLNNIQITTELLIEGGSQIPVEDEDWSDARWDVYFLYTSLPTSTKHSLVGYVTFYNFFTYLPGYDYSSHPETHHSRTRLSQFVILPPYQRQGHGSVLYDTVYAQYLADPSVLEITVEDPNEAFDILRYARDLPRLRKAKELPVDLTPSKVREAARTKPETSNGLLVTPSTFLSALRKELKLPERHFLQLLELHLLSVLNGIPKGGSKEARKTREDEERAYRLLIKERIYRQNKDSLAELEESERKEKLQETYESVVEGYREVLEGLKPKRREREEEEDGGARKKVKRG